MQNVRIYSVYRKKKKPFSDTQTDVLLMCARIQHVAAYINYTGWRKYYLTLSGTTSSINVFCASLYNTYSGRGVKLPTLSIAMHNNEWVSTSTPPHVFTQALV